MSTAKTLQSSSSFQTVDQIKSIAKESAAQFCNTERMGDNEKDRKLTGNSRESFRTWIAKLLLSVGNKNNRYSSTCRCFSSIGCGIFFALQLDENEACLSRTCAVNSSVIWLFIHCQAKVDKVKAELKKLITRGKTWRAAMGRRL